MRRKALSQAGWWVERCQRDGSFVTHNQMSYFRAMTWHLDAVLVPSFYGKPRELTKRSFFHLRGQPVSAGENYAMRMVA